MHRLDGFAAPQLRHDRVTTFHPLRVYGWARARPECGVILFVDLEHQSTYDRRGPGRVMAMRTQIAYRLEDLSGHRCLLQRYDRVDPAMVRELDIAAVFISGQGADRSVYRPDDLEGLRNIVDNAHVPIFGFCGGMQYMAEFHGALVERLGLLGDGEEDPYPDWEPGWRKELGYAPVDLTGAHPLTRGMGANPVFRHAHTWEVPEPPPGFRVLASTSMTAAQLVVDDERRQAGAQFHPEYWNDDHPDGRTLIENFCRWSGLVA